MSVLKNDTHLQNLIRQVREELQDNRPVMAHSLLVDLEKYIYQEYGNSVAKPVKGKGNCEDCGKPKVRCECDIPF